MTTNETDEKAQFIVMGYVLQAVMNDLKDEGIHFDLGENSEGINDFFQVVIIAKKDMIRANELLEKYK
jgi:hypothetical protein